MNKITLEHYPAAKLPEELRQGIDPTGHVTVTIVEEDAPPERVLTLKEVLALRQPPYRSAEDIDAAIRRARDDWDR